VDHVVRLEGAIRDLSDPMVIMRRVVDQALGMIGGAEGAVVELALDGDLVYVCAAGTLLEHVGTRLRMDQSLSGLAVRTGETVSCEDAETDERVDAAACRRVGAVSMVCVPLRRAGEPIGVLKVSARRPGAFTGEDVATLSSLAGFISAAIAAVSDLWRITGALLDGAALAQAGSDGGKQDSLGRRRAGGISEFVANVLRPGMLSDLAIRQRIERVLAESAFTICCQPIVELDTGALVGAEALARFPGPPRQPPDVWFEEAQRAGLGVALELAAVRIALALLGDLPEATFLAINVGPDTIVTQDLAALVSASPRPDRIVFELTEHLAIEDYPHLQSIVRQLRGSGTRLAIDDAGAGFASLSHIVHLAPDLIKLDRQFTAGIDLDPARRALAQALVSFASDTGAEIIAEGIETIDELEAVRRLGIPYGQGYLFSRPVPVRAMPHRFEHRMVLSGPSVRAGSRAVPGERALEALL
jgi:EAL domain-containing protein (putative c-di-GMP-specific phosphodiesterase class I)